MKKHVTRFRISVKITAAEIVFLSFVLQFLFGSSSQIQREEDFPVYVQFNQLIKKSQVVSSICIGPFRSDVRWDCNFFPYTQHEVDCLKCYPHGCHENSNFNDITAKLMDGNKGPIEKKIILKDLSQTYRALFIDAEVKCPWLKRDLAWHVGWCEHYEWSNDRHPQCPADTLTTKTTTQTWPPFTKPTTKTTNKPTTLTNSITWTATSSTIGISSFPNFSRPTSLPISHRTEAPLRHRQINNSSTDIDELGLNKSNFNNKILWISLGATAIVCTLTVFVVLFCQRAKIAKFLRKCGNPPDIDSAAYHYTDVSIIRPKKESAIDSVTYDDVIPNSVVNHTYTELDLSSIQDNLNSANVVPESNYAPFERDVNSYVCVDPVIYEELN